MSHRVLVAHSTIRQVRAVGQVDRLASALDRLVQSVAADIHDRIPDRLNPSSARPLSDQIRARVVALARVLATALHRGLTELAEWGYDASAQLLSRRLRALGKSRLREGPDALYADYVVAPPTASVISALVGPTPANLTTAVPAQRAADVVYDGIAQGFDRRRIVRDLGDVLGLVGSTARRIARTEGLRVATVSQLAASEQISDLVAGYQVLAVLDDRTRPEHRRRSGTIYWRNPRPGQLGFDRMPRPPLDPPFPPGTIAWNCRCTLAPVFETDPVPSAIPDPDEMGAWWASAPVPDRESLVGPERYGLATRGLKRPPTWRDFIDPATEDLIPLEALKAILHSLA